MQTFVTEAVDWPETAPALREQVRALVAAHGERDPVRRANCWTKANP
ncbi:MAG TPA: acyl-CoA dehydrogenase, partial [Erythrobacter sp.]|nr:acyl-CoA dehydrogenase [Erythrobacter sp.]